MTIKENDWLDLRVRCKRTWPDGKITIEILSAEVAVLVTLMDGRDVVRGVKGREVR